MFNLFGKRNDIEKALKQADRIIEASREQRDQARSISMDAIDPSRFHRRRFDD